MSKELFTLGKIYPSDFLLPEEQPLCPPVELKLVLDDDGIVKLSEMAPADKLWGSRYWYSSSISGVMKEQLKDVVREVLSVLPKIYEPYWVDIAGNTGYMLSQVPDNFYKINIDPVLENPEYLKEAKNNCDEVVPKYFTAFDYFQRENTKADVVSCVSMFYDLQHPEMFLKDVYEIMNDNALFVLQMSYSPLMIKQLEFANICHEHARYYSFFNLKTLLEKHNFRLMDVSLNNTNAGSFRVFAMKKDADITKFGSQTHRDVCEFRMKSLLEYEKTLALDEVTTWRCFFNEIEELKEKSVSFIKEQVANGKTIYGYGASTKFNTTLQYFGLDYTLIKAIAERSPAKYGRRTIGSNIPIISEEEMRLEKPDFLLLGPAHFLSEFMERERELLLSGTQFICIMPEFKLITKNDL